MPKVVVVTDSTAYLPKNILQELNIQVVPLHVIWGDKIYKDGVDLKAEEFYPMLKAAKELPTTSQPSPQEFIDVYKPILDKGDKIISIHISSGISGTLNSAHQAKEMLETKDVEIIDSKSSGMALGYVAMETARYAQKGNSYEDCIRIARKAVENIDVYFVVDTLEYLHKGGRIGGASAVLGSALDLKPILYFNKEGKLDSFEKVRTKKKAMKRLLEIAQEKVGEKKPIHFAIMQVEAMEDAEFLRAELEKMFKPDEIAEMMIVTLSPVIGSHTGPGLVSISFLAGM
ncbi:MAG: DegV family protein [Pelolinea sp.]|nr:DegV family protein [Pelolinea sp.]